MLCILVYLSFILILLSNILIVGLYLVILVINGMPRILCFISVIWKVCLNGLFKSLFLFHCFSGNKEKLIFSVVG